MAGRYPKCMTEAMAYGMENAALVMDELGLSARLFPRITRQGQERMRTHVQVLRAGLNRQMDLDRKDMETARALNACIETAAKERPVAEPAHT